MTEGSAEQEQRERRRDDFEGARAGAVRGLARVVTALGQARGTVPAAAPPMAVTGPILHAIAEAERLALDEIARLVQADNPYEAPPRAMAT